jgi:peptidoglycan hydrolase-like protein with peptidoglycan-binding domain
MSKRLALMLAVLLAVPLSVSLAPSPASAADLPLCRYAANHTNGAGQNMAVPVAANGSRSCFMSRYAVPCGGLGCTSVVQLQRSLNRCHRDPRRLPRIAEDGWFGGNTEAALKLAQGAAGASPDGKYGNDTRNRIGHESNDVPGLCHRF